MSVRHSAYFVGECPKAWGPGDSAVEEENQVSCIPCLRKIAAAGQADDGDAGERLPAHLYLLGYCDGKEAAYAEIVEYLDGEPHHRSCTCDPCSVVRGVWGKGLRMARAMMGPEAWN